MSKIIAYSNVLGGHGAYFKFNDKNYELVLDPSMATEFANQEEAISLLTDKTSTCVEQIKVFDLKGAKAKFAKWAKASFSLGERSYLNKSLSRKYDPQKDTVNDVIDWHWKKSLEDEDLIRYEDYKSWPKLWSVTKNIWDVTGYEDYKKGKHFQTFSLVFRRDDQFEAFKKEIDYILKNFEITCKDEKGNIRFDVFDHYLSEGGNTVSFYKINKNKWEVRPWGSVCSTIVSGDLKTCFEYLKKERYYG
jgi:hypothetical protein